MSQTDLVARIAALEPPSPAAWFALLCTYYVPTRLREAENRLVARKIPPLRLLAAAFGGLGREELRASLAALRGHASNPAAFDEHALGMLKALGSDALRPDAQPARRRDRHGLRRSALPRSPVAEPHRGPCRSRAAA